MKTYEKSNKLEKHIQNKILINKYKMRKEDFTRKRKIEYEDIIHFTLNKRGLSLNMEIHKFEKETGKLKKISKSGLCQQRKKIAPGLFKELNAGYIYNSYDNKDDYQTIKGYIVMAIDGMKIEVPDSEELREAYGVSVGQEGQRTSARALTSCIYDVVNNWVIDAQIDKYKASERELAKKHIEEMYNILHEEIDVSKIIIIFDRGYVSLEMINFLEELGIKYLFRMDKKKYAKEVGAMKTVDEEINIEITEKRLRDIKDIEVQEQLKKKGNIVSRVVKYELETKEIEILITNIAKEEFTTEEIGKMYFRRWNIELAYNIAKNKLEIQNFSGHSQIVVEQEFYAQMLMMNLAEDFKKDANSEINKTRKNGYKYDYQVNMNTLIGLLREKFVLILISMGLNRDKKSHEEYENLLEEIRSNLVPIRPDRKNPRKRYKGYNKYKKNLRRNS